MTTCRSTRRRRMWRTLPTERATRVFFFRSSRVSSASTDDLDLAQLAKAGYSLSLNSTAGTSDPFSYTPTSYGGILFSYANNKTFALSNDYNITIHCGQTPISTATTNTLDAWNQIILADERDGPAALLSLRCEQRSRLRMQHGYYAMMRSRTCARPPAPERSTISR